MIKKTRIAYSLRLTKYRKIILAVSCSLFAMSMSLVVLTFPPPTTAQETTHVSTPSSDLKSKLKVLETEIASKAAKLKQEVSKTLQNKVFLGSIKSKTEFSFTLNTNIKDQQILIKDYTDFLDKTKIKYKDLKETDIVAVLGDIDNDNSLAAKRIIKLSSLPIERKIIWGQFLSSSSSAAIKSQVKITIKDKTGKTIDINTSKDTDYESKSTEASLKLLKENDPLVIVTVPGKDGILFARLIYLFQEIINTKPKSATISAIPTNTPNIKISSKPKN